MRILIVEDEVRLAETLRQLLRGAGYTVDVCHDGLSGLDNAGSGIYDLAILDVMLPKLDGLTLLQTLRREGQRLKVLLLTARSEVSDRVAGLDSGADYYLTKPFEPQELLSCVRALLRRGDERGDAETICWEDLTLERGSFSLCCGGRSVRLSRREFDIMELLMQNGQQVVSKEQLLVKVWGYDSEAEDNNVEVYISFLRRKLAHLHSAVSIKTLRRLGYCLEVSAP